jgi:hypothetical protein
MVTKGKKLVVALLVALALLAVGGVELIGAPASAGVQWCKGCE